MALRDLQLSSNVLIGIKPQGLRDVLAKSAQKNKAKPKKSSRRKNKNRSSGKSPAAIAREEWRVDRQEEQMMRIVQQGGSSSSLLAYRFGVQPELVNFDGEGKFLQNYSEPRKFSKI